MAAQPGADRHPGPVHFAGDLTRVDGPGDGPGTGNQTQARRAELGGDHACR